MQTGITVHDTDQEQRNAMNSTPNRGNSRKEEKMNAITKATSVAVLVALSLSLKTWAAEPPKVEPQKGKDAARVADVAKSAPVTQKAWRWDASWSINVIGGLKIPDGSREYLGKLADQVWRRDLLVLESDRDALDIDLRRTRSLLDALVGRKPDLAKYDAPLRQFEERARQIDPTAQKQRGGLLTEVVKLRREIAFANPLLDFQQILFVKSQWPRAAHCVEQYFGFHANPGGGLCVLEDAFGPEPKVRDLLAGVVVETGPMKGRSLEGGAFLSPALSYDGRTILFAWTRAMPPAPEPSRKDGKKSAPGWGNCHTVENGWGDPDSCYHIFSVRVDGTQLRQLTDGPWNDLFPCFLPDGRIVFMSERRGGYGRCFSGRPAPTFTLHRMNADGSDMVILSWHETNEWHPSITHAGAIAYTRWDYVDRGACIAHHPWLTSIDGRDARAIHGNYPADGDNGVRPDMEMEIRAIPGSQRYIATAAPHHGHAQGSLVIFDPRVPDDDRMGPVKRLTPATSFPEAEKKGGRFSYSAPYPLAEDFHLCSVNGSLCLIDGFGNHELLYPGDGKMPLRNPIPLRPTPTPPIMPELSRPLPARTAAGKATTRPAGADTTEANEARVALGDVYNSRYPFPKDARIKSLRIIQILPKTTPFSANPWIAIGVAGGNNARRVLGIVPVESDGSAYFTLPAGKAVYLQALDERGLAVQSMRSLMYCQPGERLSCAGCHEEPTRSPPQPGGVPLAMRREPSRLTSEIEGVTSWTYGALAAPAVQRSCASCHRDRKVPFAVDGKSLSAFGSIYAGETMLQKDPKVGGSRTLPGQFSVRASRLPAILEDKNHKGHIPMDDFRRIALWLDLGCPTLDDYGDGRKLD